MENIRQWLLSLPTNLRMDLLDLLYIFEVKKPEKMTRSDYFSLMSTAWQVLYTPDWSLLHIPDLQSLVQARQDIKTDSPSAMEDMERVLKKLGLAPSIVPTNYYLTPVSLIKEALEKKNHMGHTDMYSSIYDIILSFDTSKALSLKLHPYSNKNVYSVREKQLLYSIIPQLKHLQVLELGYAADDLILQQLGVTCSTLRKLKIAGSEVTDAGLEMMLDEGERSGLCRSMQSFSIHSTALITMYGVMEVLKHLYNLSSFSCQESIMLQLLRSEQCLEEGWLIPVRSLELTLGTGRRDYLGPASTLLTQLTHLTLWCFEPENASSLSGFNSWRSWTQLSKLTLNNIAYCDLLSIINSVGHQLQELEIDNFSNDESDLHIYLDVFDIARLCPHLCSLSISMAFVDFQIPKCLSGSDQIFSQLSNLHLKSNKYKTAAVLTNILSFASNVEKLVVQSQVSRAFLSIEEQDTLKDEDMLDIIKENQLLKLKTISLTALEHPHALGCKLPLTDFTLDLLLTHCPLLESIGDLSKWNLEDIDHTMKILDNNYWWTRNN